MENSCRKGLKMRSAVLINVVIFIALSVTGYGLMMYFDQHATPPVSPVVQAADFSLTSTEGSTHTLADFRGKNVILNFWASWCAPCIKEFPTLLDVAEQNKKDTVLIALSYDLTDEAMQKFLKNMKAKGHHWEQPHIIIARDEKDIAGKLYGITRFPETLLINANGQIRDRFVGAEWTADDMNNSLRKLHEVQ
jgi:cytochrome c biogenesis protein CcmG/thiol:disulfide interchange protein DsbE